MITIKGRFLTYGELWFDEAPPAQPVVDIIRFRLRPAPVDVNACSLFLSLVSDLSVDDGTIMASFGSTNRYKVKRADSKDGLNAEFMPQPKAHLEEFCRFYDAFAQQKTLEASYRRGLLASWSAGKLVLTAASREGERIVWHAYIRSGTSAALLHSASHFRGKDSAGRALVGRANRWLHWRDMLAFKEAGVVSYDWGGMFEDESVPEQASINAFKREFGGRAHRAYDCAMPVSIKGRAYLTLRRSLERLKGESPP
jgi:hypothetical protein